MNLKHLMPLCAALGATALAVTPLACSGSSDSNAGLGTGGSTQDGGGGFGNVSGTGGTGGTGGLAGTGGTGGGDPCPGATLCNGVCTQTSFDPMNCGSCGNECASGEVCSAGQCGLNCSGGTTQCGSLCVNTDGDPLNCGACGNACAAGEVCSSGQCGLTCVGGSTKCGTACVNTQSDAANCGSCGNACAAGEVCSGGSCGLVCSGGTTKCGTGVIAALAADIVGAQGQVSALDPSAGMLAETAQRASTAAGSINVVQGLGESLPFADARFDFVVMGYALRHVADLHQAFTEYRRVLKPGGRLLLLEISRPESRLGYVVLKGYLKHVIPTLTRLLRRSPEAQTLMVYYWATIEHCVEPAAILAALHEAGLEQVARRVELGVFSDYTAQA